MELALYSAPARSQSLLDDQMANIRLLNTEKFDDDIEKKPWDSRFMKALEYRDRCVSKLTVFVAKASRDRGLLTVSTDLLGQMRDLRWRIPE